MKASKELGHWKQKGQGVVEGKTYCIQHTQPAGGADRLKAEGGTQYQVSAS